jgi:hypothetical protein
MPANSWQVGALYPPGGLNNVKWSQPGGIGTQVFPTGVVSVDFFAVTPFNENSGIFVAGCSHYMNQPLVQREWDFETNSSVALICCVRCGYVQYVIEPFEAALNTTFQPQLPI